MSESAFKAWGVQAAKDRDAAHKQINSAMNVSLATQITKQLHEELNQQ